MADVTQLVFNGLLVGSIYALGAVGLTLVYSILRLVNFSHGDLLTTGAFAAWIVVAGGIGLTAIHMGTAMMVVVAITGLVLVFGPVRETPTDILVVAAAFVATAGALLFDLASTSIHAAILNGLVVAAGLVTVFSIALDRVLWKRLRDQRANLLTLMIVSIGVAFMLRSVLQMIFGGSLETFFQESPRQVASLVSALDAIGLTGLRINAVDLWVLATTVAAVTATHAVLTYTRTGKAMRALSDNPELARVSGIDIERVITYVWILGGILAGLAGALLAMKTTLHVNLGWFTLLSLFAAVILGGVGSATGAMLGGVLIGVTQEVSTLWIDPGYKLAVGFAILILTLLFRPQGIMGVGER